MTDKKWTDDEWLAGVEHVRRWEAADRSCDLRAFAEELEHGGAGEGEIRAALAKAEARWEPPNDGRGYAAGEG